MESIINERAHQDCLNYFGNWVVTFEVENFIAKSTRCEFKFNKEILN